MKKPSEILFLTLLAILPSLYGSVANAQLIGYSYYGNPFYYGERQLQIHFLVDDALISKDGHFETQVNLTNDNSPFNGFIIADGFGAISDLRLDPEYDSRRQKYLDVTFNADTNGQIKNWKITADDIYMSPYGGSFYTIESIFNFQDNPDQDVVVSIDTDEFGDSYRTVKYVADTHRSEGYWIRTVIPVSSVPLPGSLLFFITGFCGFVWRRLATKN